MVWMTMTDGDGHALYLQISRIEPRRANGGTIHAVQAIVGDGVDETAVLMEVGDEVTVTFVDRWLDVATFRRFINHYDQFQLEQILRETVQSLTFCTLHPPGKGTAQVLGYQCAGRWQTLPGMSRPHPLCLPQLIAEEPPVWCSVA